MIDTVVAKSSYSEKFLELANENEAVKFTRARAGLLPEIFYHFAKQIKMSDKALAQLLNLSTRTISNYNDTRKRLAPLQSEHILKLIGLFSKGEELFGSVDEFNYWLNKPFWNLEEKPIDWLITPGGVDLVTLELDRLAYGYPA